MRLWLKARGAHWMALAVVSTVGLVAALGNTLVQVPAVIGGGISSLPVVLLTPVLFVGVLNATMSSRLRPQEVLALRHRGRWDAGLLAVYLLLLSVPLGGLSVMLGSQGPTMVARNAIALSATALVVMTLIGPAGGICAAVALLLGTSSYGPAAPYAEYIRFLQSEATSAPSWILTGTLLAVVFASLLANATVRPGLEVT